MNALTFGPWIDSNAPWYIRLQCRLFGHLVADGQPRVCDRCHAFRRRVPLSSAGLTKEEL